jgi:hypothetical protein
MKKTTDFAMLRKRFGGKKKGKPVEEKDTAPDMDEQGMTGKKGEMPFKGKFSKIK